MSLIKKFRAWGKNIKEYLSQDGIEPYHFTLKDISKGCIYDLDLFVMEQYTGLKDKNGKEIYVGDIVEYDWYIRSAKPYRVKKQVVFDDMGARVGNDRIRNCSNVVVIGNTHENPELLEAKNE